MDERSTEQPNGQRQGGNMAGQGYGQHMAGMGRGKGRVQLAWVSKLQIYLGPVQMGAPVPETQLASEHGTSVT